MQRATPGGEAAQMHHIVVVFLRWREAADDPVERTGIGTIEQSFDRVEPRVVEPGEMGLEKVAEIEIALLRSAMPTPSVVV
jgi:hypothetical protein